MWRELMVCKQHGFLLEGLPKESRLSFLSSSRFLSTSMERVVTFGIRASDPAMDLLAQCHKIAELLKDLQRGNQRMQEKFDICLELLEMELEDLKTEECNEEKENIDRVKALTEDASIVTAEEIKEESQLEEETKKEEIDRGKTLEANLDFSVKIQMLPDNSSFSLSTSVSLSLVFHIVLFYGDNQNCSQSSTNFSEIVIFNVFSPNKVTSKEFYKLLAILNFLNLMGQFFLDHRKRKRLRQISFRESNYWPGLEISGILHALVDDDFVEVQVHSMTDDGIIVGLALPHFYLYSRGVKEFLGTIRQHVFLVRSAEDANAFLVNDFQNPLLRTLSSLELPRAVSAAIEPSMSMPVGESPSNDSQERTDVGIRSGSFNMLQYNMKQRHKAQDHARDFVYLLYLGLYFSCLLACKMFDKIPYRDFVAWSILRTLRWACRISGHDTLGKEMVGNLIEFKAHEAVYYALWLNIYSLVGNWEKVWNVQKFLQEKRVIHEFVVDHVHSTGSLSFVRCWMRSMTAIPACFVAEIYLELVCPSLSIEEIWSILNSPQPCGQGCLKGKGM